MNDFFVTYFAEAQKVLGEIDAERATRVVACLAKLKAEAGRLFVLGVGGSAAHASHAAADFRKLAGIDAYAPTDNLAELTARTNDEGWETVFAGWLTCAHLSAKDALLIFSVSGGDLERKTSLNIVNAIDLVRTVGARVLAVLGKDTGYVGKLADAAVIIPALFPSNAGPHTIALTPVVWKALALHPSVHNSI